MSYIKPQDVIAPQDRWKLDRVLYDGGEDQWAVAKGTWYEEETLAIRWNGGKDGDKGNPTAYGRPTWLVIPDELTFVVRAVIALLHYERKNHV